MYTITSKVLRGCQMGRKLGFRTANLFGDIPDGVYCGTAELAGHRYDAVIFAGVAKTFERTQKTVEVHILHDFGQHEFYDQEIALSVEKRLRDNRKFEDVEQLKDQIRKDCDMAHELLY